MVIKFDPQQVNFRSIPSLSTEAQDATAQLFGQFSNAMGQIAQKTRQKEAEQQAERQNEILAQTKEAAADSVKFANNSMAARASSDFNKAAQAIRIENEGNPEAVAEQLTAFAKGQVKGFGNAVNEQDYLTVVQPSIAAFAAQAQKKSNQDMRAQTEGELQEAAVLQKEQLLALDFSIAQSEQAIEVGSMAYQSLVDQLDIPDAEKRMMVDSFRKELGRKAIIDNYDNADDKDGFIAELSKGDIAGFSVEEKADLVKTLNTINSVEKKAIELGNAEAEAEKKAVSANLYADLRILANNPASSPQDLLGAQKKVEQLRSEGTLDPQQAANLTIEINNRLGGAVSIANATSAVADALNGVSVGLDPKDKNNVKAVEMATQKLLDSGAEPEAVMTKVTDLAAKTGIVPNQVNQMFRIASRSNNPDAAQRAAEMYSRMEEQAPNLISDLSEKDVAFFSEMTELTRSGMTNQEAYEAAKEFTDPLNSAVVQSREKQIQDDKLLQDSLSDVQNIFDGGFFGSEATLSIGSVSETVVVDYENAFKRFYRHKPDSDWAKKQAEKIIKRKWDVTNTDGRKRVMAYPPERFYSIPGVDNEWMQKDFKQSLSDYSKSALPAPDLSEAFLVPDPITAREAINTGEPSYRVMYIDQKDGTIKPLTGQNDEPLLWKPDRQGMIDKMNKKKIKEAGMKRAVEADTEAGFREALGGVRENQL